jgi:ribosomal protein S27AE
MGKTISNLTNLTETNTDEDIPDCPTHPCPKCGKDEWAVAPDGQHYYCGNCSYLRPNPGESFTPCRCGCRDKWQTPWGEQIVEANKLRDNNNA